MELLGQLEQYRPFNEQEERDRDILLRCLREEGEIFTRDNAMAHMTASAWVVNRERTKVLMAYHNIYHSCPGWEAMRTVSGTSLRWLSGK